jgi:hypothetical protein
MNDTRTTQPQPPHNQDLREAFASLISMLLGLLRAHGLRGLIHLPAIWQAARELRRMGEEFIALLAAFRAGTLPPVPAPSIAPQQLPAAPAQPPATPRASARPAAPRHRRPPQPSPANPARAQLARAQLARAQLARAQLACAGVRARTRPWRRPSTPDPFPAPLGLVRATASQKRYVLAALPFHAQFVTISKPYRSSAARQPPTLNPLPNHPHHDTEAHA